MLSYFIVCYWCFRILVSLTVTTCFKIPLFLLLLFQQLVINVCH